MFHNQGDSDAALDVGSVSVGQRTAALGLYDAWRGHLDAADGTYDDRTHKLSARSVRLSLR
ncbi:MAG: hypothetical protein P1P84_03480 [Deferrisomatales bacterium]|nr:hypothetical protein [Deferrisomatales bacterium]